MITVIKDKDGNIKTYSESNLVDYNTVLGESIEQIETTMAGYAGRFHLAAPGFEGSTITLKASEFILEVVVSSNLNPPSVDVDINGLIDTVPLIKGAGILSLATDTPGIFIIQPADRKTFCAAGSGMLIIEVVPNE